MNKNKLSTLNKNFTPELDHHLLQGRRSRPLGRALPTLKKRWNSSSQIEGFTIIEVVLVLAIAGLIFLMVFIALPALQRSQRNAQYKNNLSVVVGLLQNYKSNNRGQYPPDDPSVDTGIMVGIARHTDHPFYRYVQESGLQDRTRVAIRTLGGANITPTIGGRRSDAGRIVIHKNGQCSAPSGPFGSFTINYAPSKTAIWTILEEGANGMIYCQDI